MNLVTYSLGYIISGILIHGYLLFHLIFAYKSNYLFFHPFLLVAIMPSKYTAEIENSSYTWRVFYIALYLFTYTFLGAFIEISCAVQFCNLSY